MIIEFLNYLEHQKRYSLHTVSAYKKDLEQFAAYLEAEKKLSKASSADVRSWLLFLLKNKNTESTLHRKISSLKSFYKYQMQQGYRDSNPAANILLPKQKKKIPSFLKEKETGALFSSIKYPEGFEGFRDEIILYLFYGTGMRVSELCQLKISSVDYHRKLIKVLGKRNKERWIPLLPSLFESLTNYIDKRDDIVDKNDSLFVSKSNKALNRNQVYYIVRKYLSQVSSALKRSPHVLRHTFATQMLNGGADINALKELLGHSSLAATQVYTHTTKEQLKRDYKQAHPRA